MSTIDSCRPIGRTRNLSSSSRPTTGKFTFRKILYTSLSGLVLMISGTIALVYVATLPQERKSAKQDNKESEIPHLFFGVLQKMDPSRLKEPDRRRAQYLRYECGGTSNIAQTVAPWIVSIAILNPNISDASLDLKQLARRNFNLRNNITDIKNVLSVCGGVMISSYWGLTAQHCIKDNIFLKVVVRGRRNISNLTNIRHYIREIRKVVSHPRYDSVFKKNDLAIFKLTRPFMGTGRNLVACLPNRNVIPTSGKICYYGGWGVISNSSSTLHERKWRKHSKDGIVSLANSPFMQFEVELENPISCQRRYQRLHYDVNYNLCDRVSSSKIVGGEDHSNVPCKGFSGSPLTCKEHGRWVVYGVVNWGGQSCDLSLGRGYALLSTQLTWICCETKLAISNCVGVEC